jgi:hypothetical protein
MLASFSEKEKEKYWDFIANKHTLSINIESVCLFAI